MAEPWEFFNKPDGAPSPMPPPTPAPTGGRNPWEFFPPSVRGTENPIPPDTTSHILDPYGEGPEWRQHVRQPLPQMFGAELTDATQGIPIARNWVPPTEQSENFRASSPTLSAIGRVGAGATAIAPLSYAAAAGTGASFLPYLFGQGALGAGINLADAHSSANPPGGDALQNLIIGGVGAAGGAAGAVGTRVAGPAGVGRRPEFVDLSHAAIARFTPHDQQSINNALAAARAAGMSHADLARNPAMIDAVIRAQGRVRANNISNTLGGRVPALVGGAIGHGYGPFNPGGALTGAAVGQIAANAANRVGNSRGGRTYLGSTVSPEIAALIAALGQSTGSNIIPPADTTLSGQ